MKEIKQSNGIECSDGKMQWIMGQRYFNADQILREGV